MSEEKTLKPWYKKWWGVLLAFMFFPIVIPILVWTKTSWNKWIKIAITVFCVILIFSGGIGSSLDKRKSLEFVNEAEAYINENKIEEALSAIYKSKELNPIESENPAFALDEKISKLQSSDFLKQSLISMTDSDYNLLKEGKLETNYIDHEKLNKLFLVKLQENSDKRTVYISEAEELKKKEQEETERKRIEDEANNRKEMIENQFSVWDGSHIKLTKLIKESMNNPKSYEHVETKYWDMNDHLIVSTTFRGTNAFGGVVKNSVKAKISLDGENIEILEQY